MRSSTANAECRMRNAELGDEGYGINILFLFDVTEMLVGVAFLRVDWRLFYDGAWTW